MHFPGCMEYSKIEEIPAQSRTHFAFQARCSRIEDGAGHLEKIIKSASETQNTIL